MIGTILALALAQSACGAPTGISDLLNGDQRIVVVGEMHGATETPAAFTAIVCEAAIRGPVTVALELPQPMQPQLDAFLAADTEAEAVAALDGTWFMNPRIDDGRTSRAMLKMMQDVRRLRVEGRDIAIVAFQPGSARPAGFPQSYYELEMGYLLSLAALDRAEAKVFALVGNIHAGKTGNANFPTLGLPAAAHLPADETVTLYTAQQGGEAWNCRAECGVHPMADRYDAEARGVILEAYGDGAYDGVLALGPMTASPPIMAPED